MNEPRPLINPASDPEESEYISSVRPNNLHDFIGQSKLKQNLSVFISAAKGRGETLDHVLFYGPPGLGKTTLSRIIAKEMESELRTTAGPILAKAGDLAAILTNLQHGDVLFIDEIHRLPTTVEEMLYSAMEDFSIDLIIGDGPAARMMKINVPPFTLVGATTRLGMLSNPLRDRFGIPMKLDFYNVPELAQVIERGSKIFNMSLEADACIALAQCARGTPRIALRLLRRIRDFADHEGGGMISEKLVSNSLTRLGVDRLGLDDLDYHYLNFIANNFEGGPVGIDTISAGLSEDRDTIEDTVEPYLMQIGFLARSPRGRILTQNCLNHLVRSHDLDLSKRQF